VIATSRTSREIDFSASLSILLYQNVEEKKEGIVRVIVNKNRNGDKPTLMCKADFAKMKFIDLGILID
jgi:replicative DNA helicase